LFYKAVAGFLASLKTVVRADPGDLAAWLGRPVTIQGIAPLLACIIGGCGLHGFSIGLWRAPLQGVYVAAKMPFLILLTLMVNGLINGTLGILLGSGMSFRQTLTACLMSFAIYSMIVGSLSPIVIAMVLDGPLPSSPEADGWYRVLLLMQTGMIALAGVVSNYKLLKLIQHFAGSPLAGRRVLLAWLGGNLFVGSQLSYNLRPFFGNPKLPVEFLRPDPFDGNFYLAVGSLLKAPLSWTLEQGVLPLIPAIVLLMGGRILYLRGIAAVSKSQIKSP
jgi:hypothetical protein